MKNLLFVFFLYYSWIGQAQVITTFAGNGSAGPNGDGEMATVAAIGEPHGCAFDSHGNFYFTDVLNNEIRKVTPSGIISTIAGTGTSGYNGDGIQATNAELNTPSDIAFDSQNNIYITDGNNNRVRRIDAITGIISTIAGNGSGGYNGDGATATATTLNGVGNICFDQFGNLYITDVGNNRVRKLNSSTGNITTVAGNGSGGSGGDGEMATDVPLEGIGGICIDANGNLYIAETNTARVRKINTTGIITTIAGNGFAGPAGDGGASTAAALVPYGLAFDKAGNLYVSGWTNNDVRKIDNFGIIHTIAGTGMYGFSGDNGAAIAAELGSTWGIALDTCGNLYIADEDNYRIRKVAFNPDCLPLSVNNINEQAKVYVYPNPTYDILNIGNIKSQTSYTMLNVIGQVALQGTLKAGSNSISVSSLPPGVYMLELIDKEGEKIVRKIVKE